MYIPRDAAQQNIWQIRIAGSVGQLKKRRYHKAAVTRRWFVKKHASTYAQCRARLADGKSMLFVNEQHDVTLLGWLQSFFRSHPSRPDFPGLSPHTFV